MKLILLALMLSLLAGCDRAVTADGFEQHPIRESDSKVQVVDLGLVMAGGRERELVWVEAITEDHAEIVDIRSGCECVSVTLDRHTSLAADRLVALIEADLSHQPNFLGGLRVEVELIDTGGIAFARLEVHLRAVSADLIER